MSLLDAAAEIKQQYPDCLVLFRIGDFYEAIGSDAEILAEVCELTLTVKKGVSLSGFPTFHQEEYFKRLLGAGQRIMVAEQLTDSNLPNSPPEVRRIG